MKKHQDPTPSVIVQRYKFNSRVRHTGESVASYVAELHHLSEHCEYGDTLNDMLRDRLVCSIADSCIQRALLAEKELTFDKIYEKALAMESTEKNTQDLTAPAPVQSVGLSKPTAPKSTQGCHRCGEKHNASKCKFKEAKCHKCGKIGHLARVCRSQPQLSRLNRQPTRRTSHQTNVLSNDEDTYSLFTVTQPATQPLSATFQLNGVDSRMDIDTGASVSIISEQTFKELYMESGHLPSPPELWNQALYLYQRITSYQGGNPG